MYVCICLYFVARLLHTNIVHMNCTIQVWLPHMRLLSKTNLAWNDIIYYLEKEVKWFLWINIHSWLTTAFHLFSAYILKYRFIKRCYSGSRGLTWITAISQLLDGLRADINHDPHTAQTQIQSRMDWFSGLSTAGHTPPLQPCGDSAARLVSAAALPERRGLKSCLFHKTQVLCLLQGPEPGKCSVLAAVFNKGPSIGAASLVAPLVVCLQRRRPRFDLWVQKISWIRKYQCTPGFLPGKSHEQRSLEGYSPWACKTKPSPPAAFKLWGFSSCSSLL